MSGTALPLVPAHRGPLLLGLTGHAGVGKDTVGDMLRAAGWHTTSLAAALRLEVVQAWGIDPELLTQREGKERPTPALMVARTPSPAWLQWAADQGHALIEPRSPRWALQQWGSFRRAQQPDYWIAQVHRWLAQVWWGSPQARCVITDVRYPNEAAALRAQGGRIVRVHRPANAVTLGPDTATHDSEQHTQITADLDLVNDGDLYDLAIELHRLVHQLASHATPSTATP